MTWTSISPDGAKSVKQNTPIMLANTAYTKDTMNVDHFWDESATADGHHRFMQTQATNDADKSIGTDATLATLMDLVYYSRYKTPTESTAQQDSQPFAISQNSSNPAIQAVLQILGIRACGVFNVDVGSGTVSSVVYSHNLRPQNMGNAGVTRNGTGRYQIFFENALPSSNYLILGGCIYGPNVDTTHPLNFNVTSGVDLSNIKTPTFFRFITTDPTASNAKVDPMQAWFVVFGG